MGLVLAGGAQVAPGFHGAHAGRLVEASAVDADGGLHVLVPEDFRQGQVILGVRLQPLVGNRIADHVGRRALAGEGLRPVTDHLANLIRAHRLAAGRDEQRDS